MSNDIERVHAALALVREIPTSKLVAARDTQRDLVKALFGMRLRELTPEETRSLYEVMAQERACDRLMRALRIWGIPESAPLTLKVALDAFATAFGDDAADDRVLDNEEDTPFWQRH